MDVRPIVYDLCTGLHGWLEPFLLEGYRCIGYDIADMCAEIGQPRPEGLELRLRDITTIHGSELKDAALIVCSPPCQRYSYMAMPWSRAKAQAAMIEADTTGEELRKLNLLFDTCFRLQREASAAAGHHIPMIVENVRGAQKWVGRAAYHYGSFYLWGDVPALMPITTKISKLPGHSMNKGDAAWRPANGLGFERPEPNLHKVPGFRFDGSGKSFQTASAEHHKTTGHANIRDGHTHTRHLTNQAESEGLKVPGISISAGKSVGFNVTAAQRYRDDAARKVDDEGLKGGGDWFGSGEDCSLQRRFSGTKQTGISGPRENGKGDKWFQDGAAAHGSRSNSRKAASAMIAKIPYPLASHIARTFKPQVIG